DPAGAVCSSSRHHSTADQTLLCPRKPRPWPTAAALVEVVVGGIFAVSLPVYAKGRQRIAHQRAALLPAVENQTAPGQFLFRSFGGTARASGGAEPPGPRKSQAPRGKRP